MSKPWEIFEAIPAGVLIIEQDTHKIVYVNPAAAHLIGAVREKITGCVCHRYVCPAEVGQCPITDLGQRVDNSERVLLTASGKRTPVLKTVAPFALKGKQYLLESFLDLSKSKQAEEDLKSSREQFRSLIANIPGITYRCRQDKDWTMLFLSDAVAQVTGYPAEDFINNVGRTYESIIHPDDTDYVAQKINSAVAAGQPWDIEYRIFHKDGSIRWVHEKGCGITDAGGKVAYLDGFILDITERKRDEETLRQQTRLQKLLMDISSRFVNIPLNEVEPAIRSSLQELAEFVGADRAYVFKYDFQNLICSNTHEWCSSGIEPQIEKLQNVPLSAVPEWSTIHRQGKPIYVPDVAAMPPGALKDILASQKIQSLLAIPMMAEQECIGFVGFDAVRCRHVYSDKEQQLLTVFAKMLANVRLRKQNEEALREAKDAADKANRAKSAFLANMSHEIRTPMNAILGFADILNAQIENPAHREYLSSIAASGKLLLNLINDILDLSKIEAGKLKLEYTAVSPRRLFNEIGQLFSQELKRKGLAFAIYIDPEMPEALILDEIRLRQIILNLVGNAVKFTSTGGVTLSAQKRFVRPDRSAVEFVFSVSDTGIGIAPDQQELIFEAFRQQDNQSHAQYGGTGLGLAICRRLVEAMGGKITLTSAPGKGSTFRVILENVSVAATRSAAETPSHPIPAITFAPADILIVDDDRINRLLLRRYLDNSPFNIREAENGHELLASVRRRRPDLVLLDMRMPVMDGSEALQKLKSDPELASIPVIIISASAMPEEKQAAMALGCDGYLSKPVRKEDLFREMARLLVHYNGAQTVSTAPDFSRLITDLPAADRARWPELVAILRAEGLTNWGRDTGILHINRIKTFAGRMAELGKQYKMEPLSSWAATLKKQADSFDIERLKLSLKSFPDLVDEIAKLAESFSANISHPTAPNTKSKLP